MVLITLTALSAIKALKASTEQAKSTDSEEVEMAFGLVLKHSTGLAWSWEKIKSTVFGFLEDEPSKNADDGDQPVISKKLLHQGLPTLVDHPSKVSLDFGKLLDDMTSAIQAFLLIPLMNSIEDLVKLAQAVGVA